LRRIKLFFPPIDSPLLTTYGRSLLPKVIPLKEKFAAFSQRREKKVLENPETVYMSSSDIDIVNSSYVKIKRSRGESVSERETEFPKDPLYKSIYEMKHRSIMQVRVKGKRNMSKVNFGE
jgi:hypothetical protein